MKIKTLQKEDDKYIQQAAQLLVEGFKENWPNAWPDLGAALEEVNECLSEDRICRIAVDENDNVLGWIGAISQYDGNVWELHPIVVDINHRRKGIGRLLVKDLEEQVRQRGGITIQAGSDDENNMTSLSNVDLYDNLLDRIRDIKNFKGHPYEFYLKLGFKIIGVMPDANGLGKPDIYLGKRVIDWPNQTSNS
ncbi:aminoglycoside N(6')-acetyltransferase [Proteiniborus sp. DW1]|uniref:GNAT family N-acetyltransferase n=1 Tax=Proteiniborus sp. DW1 TaxID=1889883 RepID=UPI00092E0ADC|nr:GNAT family N-acetyltransferase [Proteiniborus sp. DW1]SCG82427.1 aminoglycoside N(6')-acetyltransferase [Proteiniborus sp. DW1]